MTTPIQEQLITQLKQKYGKPFVRPEDGGIVVRHVNYKKGRIVYHIPATLIPDTTVAEFIDPIEGYDLPQLTNIIMPQTLPQPGNPIRFRFCSEYAKLDDLAVRHPVTHLTFCPPAAARYLLITISDDNDQLDIFHQHFQADALWSSRTHVHSHNLYPTPETGFWLLNMQDAHRMAIPQTANNSTLPDFLTYTHGAALIDGQLYFHSFHFTDAFTEECAWVITPEGYLVRPTRVQDHLNVIFGEVAQFEAWDQVSADCLAIHWRRQNLHQPHECTVVHSPQNPTWQQIYRVRCLESHINERWQNRRDPIDGSQPHFPACLWEIYIPNAN